MTSIPSRRRAPRRPFARRRLFISIGLVLVALVSFLGWRFYQFWYQPLSQTAGGTEEPQPVLADKNHFTVLLMGADNRPGDLGRSDTMLLAFVDLEKGALKLLSFPRDSYANIPGHGWDKINAAYSTGGQKLVQQSYPDPSAVSVDKLNAAYVSGGSKLVKKTVENLTGVPVDFWVNIDQGGFADMVDAVDGIDVVVDHDLNYDDPWDTPPLHIHLKAGAQRLDGLDSLHYVRFRHDDQSDWGRMARQQQAIKALIQAAVRPANLPKIPQLVKLGLDKVQTNLSPSLVAQLASVAQSKVDGHGITSVSLTGEDLWTGVDPTDSNSDEIYYTVLDFATMRKTVRELAGLPVDAKTLESDKAAAVAYMKAVPFGTVNAGAWRTILEERAVAAGEKAPATGGTTPPKGGTTPPKGGTTPPKGGTTPPKGGTTPPKGGTTPPKGGTTPPKGGTPPPKGGTTPPKDGQTPPLDGLAAPADGQTAPTDGLTPPPDGQAPPADGQTPPAESQTPPGEGEPTPPTGSAG